MLIKIFSKIEESAISLLLVATTLLVFVEVVLRFGFGTGFLWVQELTLHMAAWFVLFGASYGLKVGAHIGVDAFIKLMPEIGQRILSSIAVVLSLGYCSLFFYGGWIYLAKMKKIGIELEDIPVPAWVAHSIIVIGMVMLAIRLAILLWDIITGKELGFSHTDEAEESMHLADELKRQEGN